MNKHVHVDNLSPNCELCNQHHCFEHAGQVFGSTTGSPVAQQGWLRSTALWGWLLKPTLPWLAVQVAHWHSVHVNNTNRVHETLGHCAAGCCQHAEYPADNLLGARPLVLAATGGRTLTAAHSGTASYAQPGP